MHVCQARRLRLNSNKGTKSDMRVCPSHSSPSDYVYVASPNYRHIQAANFGGLIPTESRSLSSEKSYSKPCTGLVQGCARCRSESCRISDYRWRFGVP